MRLPHDFGMEVKGKMLNLRGKAIVVRGEEILPAIRKVSVYPLTLSIVAGATAAGR